MIHKLINYTGKPALYEKGTTNFWDDPHISKHLLEAHLDPEFDAASRRPATIEKTVSWVNGHLKEKASILDLGCGPGLYAERFATLGHKVTGVDFSKRSIEHAVRSSKEKGLDITYIYQNYLELDCFEQFDIVLLVYCDFGALTNANRDILLGKMYKALKPGGMLIFDVFTEEFRNSIETKKDWEIAEDGFWATGTYLVLSETFHYQNEQVMLSQTIVLKENGEYDVHRIYDHYYSEQDLTSMLNGAGFTGHTFHRDVIGETNFATQKVIFAVSRKG